MIKQQAQAKAQGDKTRKNPIRYNIDDYVMLKNFDATTGISPKLNRDLKVLTK